MDRPARSSCKAAVLRAARTERARRAGHAQCHGHRGRSIAGAAHEHELLAVVDEAMLQGEAFAAFGAGPVRATMSSVSWPVERLNWISTAYAAIALQAAVRKAGDRQGAEKQGRARERRRRCMSQWVQVAARHHTPSR